MIKKIHLLATLLLLVLNLSRLPAQSPVEASPGNLNIIATNGAGREKHLSSINGVVPTVMVRPGQVVPVTLQFPNAAAGTPVTAVPLDGGNIDVGDLIVSSTGEAMFTFSPGAAFGHYRVEVRTAAEHHLLEFYVVDPAHPPRH
jgi:hypothetical protein